MNHAILVSSPMSDFHLRTRAERLLADGADTPDQLEQKLREHYPHARVVPGIRDGTAERWYV